MRKRGACSPLFLLKRSWCSERVRGVRWGWIEKKGGLFCLCATKEVEGRISMKGE